jgi:CheY-like chemotaxis protein
MAKVLVADDEIPLVELLVALVIEAGHQALFAYNGQDALLLVQRERPALVLSDVMMPLMTGTELLAAIRADPALARTPVVLMSAAKPVAAISDADHYLPKPFDLPTVEALIARLTRLKK